MVTPRCLEMHIPDGFLDAWICIITYALVVIYGVFAYRYFMKKATIEHVLLIANLAAAIFVAQMLNWPIPGGTSLHFVGGALAGILLGPFLGFIVLSLVLFVQCVVFHDGGITTLGANILNMAIVDVLVGYIIYRLIMDKLSPGAPNEKVMFLGAFLGGWLGIALAGTAAGVELGLSVQFGYGLSIALPAMAISHFILGIIEGVITGLVVIYLARRGYSFPIVEVSEG